MKYFLFILMGLALATLVFNVFYLDFDNLFYGDSKTAIIGILAATCVILISLILLVSKTIEKKYKESGRY